MLPYSPLMSDAARTLYLICYDVSSPRRLYRVRKYLLGFKVGGQKSFFECWLTPAELREVRRTLSDLLDLAEDRAHIFQLDPRMKRDFMGLATQPVSSVFMII
jgi:CRISPR-associated protein Cas2